MKKHRKGHVKVCTRITAASRNSNLKSAAKNIMSACPGVFIYIRKGKNLIVKEWTDTLDTQLVCLFADKERLIFKGKILNGYPTYIDADGQMYVDIDYAEDPRHPMSLYKASPELGEPDVPVSSEEFIVAGWTDEDQAQKEHSNSYIKLSRYAMMSKAYLNDLNNGKSNWGIEPKEFLSTMVSLYDDVPVKPVWFSKKTINKLRAKIQRKELEDKLDKKRRGI